jgi:serine protease Do
MSLAWCFLSKSTANLAKLSLSPQPSIFPPLVRWVVLVAFSCFVGLAAGLIPPVAAATNNPSPPVVVRRDEMLPLAFRKGAPASIEDLKIMQQHVERLVSRAAPAVVSVQVGNGVGSGVVITSDGLVLCAAHVCGEPNLKVRFTFPDGRTAHGHTLGANHDMDSGLMKISDPGPWPHVDMAEADSLRQGDWVVALGHPGGFDPDRPVVARLGRVLRLGPLLQTDCTLMSGDSGGPLFDMHGRVVAIHSRISDSTTENFHVPIDTYLETWSRLLKGDLWGDQKPAAQATIGVRGVDTSSGCTLEHVAEDSAAFKAGLKVGDIVLRIQNEAIPDAESLARCVRRANPGDAIVVVVSRNGAEVPIKVKVEARHFRGQRNRPEP